MPKLTLLTRKGNNTHRAGGLNWGHSINAHVCRDDAYIPLHINTIRNNTAIFRPINNIANPVLTFIWDDGTRMQGRFEGSQVDSQTGTLYPKQISSFPSKNILGRYFRNRLGLPSGTFISLAHLKNYGRTDVDIIDLGNNIYSLDFHV